MLGIDIYQQFNTVTSWPAVRAAGVQFAYVKLTDGGGRAQVAGDAYVAGARGAGIKVGGYHYLEATPSPETQADVFTAELKRLNALDLAPALDIEENSIPAANRVPFGQRFLERLQANLGGARVGIYSSSSWFTSLHPDTWGIPNLIDWDAEYGRNDGGEHPITGYGGHVDVHQYTSVGHVAGIAGNVDVDDAFISDIHALAATTSTAKDPGTMADFFVKLSTAVTNGGVTTYPDCAQQSGPYFIGTSYGNAIATVNKGQGSLTGVSDGEWNDRVGKSSEAECLASKLDGVVLAINGLPAAIAAVLPAGGGGGLTMAQTIEAVKAALADEHGNVTFGD